MRRIVRRTLAAPSTAAPPGPPTVPSPAELILTAAQIHTVDPVRRTVAALAVRDGRVLFAGSLHEALALRGPATRLLDLGHATVIPGIVDAHLHLLGVGEALGDLDLTGAASYEDVIARVVARAATARPGTWIRGRGWDQNTWPGQQLPTAGPLSDAVPGHPVVLGRVDGHAVLGNARALALAGITAATSDPAGGRVVRDPGGAPTGVLVDNAVALLRRVVPPLTPEETRAAILAAIAEAHRWGLTGVHDPGVAASTLAAYEELAREGRFDLRDYVMVSGDGATLQAALARGPQTGLHGGRIDVRAIKLFADGALGSRGAALLEDYSDEPGNRGLVLTGGDEIRRVAVEALRHGFQLCTHAIGDHANRLVLDAYAAALDAVPTPDHRFRVEHAQVVSDADLPRFAALGVIPSMQAGHQAADMGWVADRLGPARARRAYAWRSLRDTGVVIPNGSDAPVAPINPMLGFHAAVTRQDAEGRPAGGWFPAERLTREEALASMTLWPAFASFTERVSGSLTPGKIADLTVLDQDIMTVAPEGILETQVLMTVLGGQIVHQRSPR
jgi:predicted amidohydrolase YtcJ